MNRKFGMDWFEVGVHAFVTICLAIALAEIPGANEDVIIPTVFGASALIFGIRRRVALRRLPPGEPTTGEVEAARLDEVEQRLAEMDLLEARVAELENRVEFSERLLAQRHDPALPRGEMS
jgi:hypothetical protein